MTRIRDRALVLRRFAYGETSLVTQLFTRSHGRVHCLAKGAYRSKSRYCGVLDLFDTLELEWSAPRGAELVLLAEASIATRRAAIARDLGRYRAALAVLELLELGTVAGQSEPALFALAEETLDGLALAGADAVLERIAFDLRFLQNLGLAPALDACAACGGPAPRPTRAGTAFSASSGGCLCPACADEARAAGRRVAALPPDVLRVAHVLLTAPVAERRRVRLAAGQTERVRAFVDRFLEYHLETRPRSRRRAPRPAR